MGYVQHKAGTSTTSVTFDSPTTAGNSIIVLMWSYNTNPGATAISDNKGNTFAQDNVQNAGVSTKCAIYRCQSPTMGSSHTISVSAGTDQGICAIEVADLDATPVDQYASNHFGSTSTPVTPTTGTLAQASEIVFALMASDQGNTDSITPAAGESWTQMAESEAGNVEFAFSALYKEVSATTALAANWTLAGAHDVAVEIATYKLAAPAGPTGTVNKTLAPLVPTISGTVSPSGGVNKTLAPLAPAISGTVIRPPGLDYVKEVGFVTNTTAGTTSAITVATGGVPVGDVIVILGSCDNTGSSGAATTISAADNHAGTTNAYTLLTPQAIADPGAASAGQQGFALVCPVTTALSAGDTITITFGNSTTAKAINAQQFTYVGSTVPPANPVLSGSYARQDNQTGQAVSLSATPTTSGQVVITAVAVEGGTADAYTEDADTTEGAWVTLTRRGSGTTTSGSTLNSAYKIVSASGTPSAQSYGTATSLGTARDHCALIFVLDVGKVSGTVNKTLAPLAPTISGTVTLSGATGTVNKTLAPLAPTISGEVSPTGGVNKTLAPLAPTISGEVSISGGVNKTLAPLAPTISGSHTTVAITGTVNKTLAPLAPTIGGLEGSFAHSIASRRIYDHAGDVWPMKVSIAWGLTQNLSTANITTALEGIQARHFNAVLFWPFGGNYGVDWDPYQDIDGNNFFTGTPFQSSFGSAWAKVDHAISECARLGLTAIFSIYLGFGTYNFYDDFVAASTSQLRTFGQTLATRYARYDNIIWHIGLDRTFSGPSGTNEGAKLDACMQGINDIEATRLQYRLRTGEHNNTGSPVTSAEQFFDWDVPFAHVVPAGETNADLWINSIYKYSQAHADDMDAGYGTPYNDLALWNCEPAYISSGHYGASEDIEFRESIYAAFFRGGVGINVGNEDRWPFGKSGLFSGGRTWQQTLTDPDAYWAQYAWDLLDSVAWADTAPSAAAALVTSGELTGDDRAPACYSASLGLIYLPTNRSVTLDLSKFNTYPSALVRKYDPTAGTFATIGTYATTSGRVISAPGTNSAGDGDWVYVIEGVNEITGTVSKTLAGLVPTISGALPPTSVDAGTGIITLQGQPATPTLAQMATALGVAQLQLAGVSVAPVTSPTSVTLGTPNVTLSGQALVPVQTPLSIALASGQLELVGQATSPSLSSLAVNLGTGTIELAGTTFTPTLAPLALALSPGQIQLAGQGLSVILSPQAVNLGVGTLTFEGQPVFFNDSPVSVDLGTGVLTLGGVPLTTTLGPLAFAAGTATVTIGGGVITPAPAALSVPLVPGSASLEGQPVSPALAGLSFALTPGVVTLGGVPFTFSGDGITVDLATAVMTLGGGSFVPTPAGLVVPAGVGTLELAGNGFTTSLGALDFQLATATIILEGRPVGVLVVGIRTPPAGRLVAIGSDGRTYVINVSEGDGRTSVAE